MSELERLYAAMMAQRPALRCKVVFTAADGRTVTVPVKKLPKSLKALWHRHKGKAK